MDQQPQQGCCRGPRAERDTLWPTGSQLFYLLVSKMPARDKLTSSDTLIWLRLLRPLFLVWPHPLPDPTRKWEEHLVAKQRQRAPLFCLIPRRSSLLPLSFLPPLWLFHHLSPSIAGFLLFQPSGGECVEGWRRDRE